MRKSLSPLEVNRKNLVLLIMMQSKKKFPWQKKKERQIYQRWTPSDRFKIGKYAAVNGNIASVRKFQAEFTHLNESNVREFKKKYNTEIANATKEKREAASVIPKYSSQTGRQLLQGELDSMVQTYIKQLSNRGCVVNKLLQMLQHKPFWPAILI